MILPIRRSLLVLALVVGLGSWTMLAADEPRLKPNQNVTLRLQDGTEVTGTLQLAGGKSVLLRTSSRGGTKSFPARNVKSISTKDATFRLNATIGIWESEPSTKPKSDSSSPPTTAKKSKPTLSSSSASKPKAKSNSVAATLTVEAEGIGDSVEEARKDAIRAAVRKVAGSLVVGSTKIENDKVIEDKVLTYSDGVIVQDSYKELSRKKVDGTWRVRISAMVLNRKLAERLTAAGFEVRPIDGENLAVAVMSRAEARRRATELLKDALDDLPRCMTARAARPTVKDYLDDTGELAIKVAVGADLKRYLVVAKRLAEILDKISLNKDVANFVCQPARSTRAGRTAGFTPKKNRLKGGKSFSGDNDAVIEYLPIQSRRTTNFLRLQVEQNDTASWYVWLLVDARSDWQQTRWLAYQLDCNRDDVLAALQGTPTLYLTLLDEDGKAIKRTEVALQSTPFGRIADRPRSGWLYSRAESRGFGGKGGLRNKAVNGPNVALGPVYFVQPNQLLYSPIQEVRCKIAITANELRRVKDIRCEVRFE